MQISQASEVEEICRAKSAEAAGLVLFMYQFYFPYLYFNPEKRKITNGLIYVAKKISL